jgi:hypothetical protein
MSITSVKSGATGISLALDNNFMEPIATTLVGSGGVNQVTFNDIPQTYKHLQIRATSRTTQSATGTNYWFAYCNNDRATNYSYHILTGDGASASAQAEVNTTYLLGGQAPRDSQLSSTYSIAVFDLLDYANTNKYKTVRALSGVDYNAASPPGYVRLISGNWRSFDAVTSLTIIPEASNFSQYSRFSLYGIKG